MATLHFQSQGFATPTITFSRFHPWSNPAQSSCCISLLPLGLKASPNCSNLRSNGSVSVLSRKRIFSAYASNPDSSESSDGSETSTGPPILTILAGLLVFAAVVWIFGSVVVWLFSLILKVPSPK